MNNTVKERRRPQENVDLLVKDANELVTVAGYTKKPCIGRQMRQIRTIHGGSLAVRNGRIATVGTTRDVTRSCKSNEEIVAKGKIVLPGFVDPHTHLVFAGSREDEFQMQVEKFSYLKILRAGGGILRTVRETRKKNVEDLVERGIERLDVMFKHGTTTVEAKSGYGLTTKEELKILDAVRRLDQLHPVDIVPTFLGAHAIPPEYLNNPQEYVRLVTEEMIPEVVARGLGEFCDVFCERGVFSLEQSRQILVAGKKLGLKPKIHADEMSLLGGAELAAEVGATSASHLLFASDHGIKALAAKGVVATLLPAAAFSLMKGRYADARSMIDFGVPVALGTDFNPSCWTENQQLVIAFACHFMELTPAEAITAATINAAHAVGRAEEIGSLEIGKKADITILNVPNHKHLGYRFGVNLVDKVIKDGRIVYDRESDRSEFVHA